MAVLIEKTSVVVRRDTIESKFAGQWQGFQNIIAKTPFCCDDDLVSVHFADKTDIDPFIQLLKNGGLMFMQDQNFMNIAVVDEQSGPIGNADAWLQFVPDLPYNGPENTVAACWFLEGPRPHVLGIHMPSGWKPGEGIELHAPEGWCYETSISKSPKE